MKQLLTLVLLLLIPATLLARPAKRRPVTITQSDGTQIQTLILGDEHHHYRATADLLPIALGTDGIYYYARAGANGLEPTRCRAHNAPERTTDEQAFITSAQSEFSKIRNLGAARRQATALRRQARLGKQHAASRTLSMGDTSNPGSFIGDKKGLVILVNFKDTQMNAAHTRQVFDNQFNQEGYTGGGNAGSVHDYFLAQSYGQFNLTFDVVGPVTVSGNLSAYGGNDSDGNDKNPAKMAYEACRLVDSQVNFADYDWDGDGEADQVYIVYAGYGEASDTYGLHPDAIWEHEWDLTSAGYSLYLDGVKINTYGCSAELYGDSGTDIDGIGSACHEFSHCMGLPDLYDTAYDERGIFGMNQWSVMDYGSYGGDGYTPTAYTSYERWVSGWLTPTTLASATTISQMQPLETTPQAYVIYNDAHKDEYYLLENRQPISFDAELPGHGMLVIHVDYDAATWQANEVNNTYSHPRLTPIAADGDLSYNYDSQLAGDPYPGTTSNTSLTDTSSPRATLYNAAVDGRKLMGKPITNITESADGLISFLFMGGTTIPAPQNPATEQITATTLTAKWDAAADAESYELQWREKPTAQSPEESVIFAQSFATLGANLKTDGNVDISTELDTYLTLSGWTGSKLYQGVGTLKMGSSKAQGVLTSPQYDAPQTESLTLRIAGHAYKNDAATLTIGIVSTNSTTLSEQTLTLDGSTQTLHFDGITQAYHLTLATTKRAYLDQIALYDGAYDESDFATSASAPAATHTTLSTTQSATTTSIILPAGTTQYTLSSLTPATTYQWRVRAHQADAASAWTEWQQAQTLTQTLISTPTALQSLSPDSPVEILLPDGRTLGTERYDTFRHSARYKGLYILMTPRGAIKVVK